MYLLNFFRLKFYVIYLQNDVAVRLVSSNVNEGIEAVLFFK